MKITDFTYDPSKKWWQTIPAHVNCLLALDPTATISDGGRTLKAGGGPEAILFAEDNSPEARVEKIEGYGFRRVENRPSPILPLEEVTSYKALGFLGGHFRFKDPITRVNDFTFILRMCRGGAARAGTNRIGNHVRPKGVVPLRGTIDLGKFSQENYSDSWRARARWYSPDEIPFPVYNVWTDYAGLQVINLTNTYNDFDLDFIVWTYSSSTNTATVYTGTRVDYPEVTAFGPSKYAYNSELKSFTHMGDVYEHGLNAHIVAMGLFDFQLTKEEIFQMLAQIDGEFLGKEPSKPIQLSSLSKREELQAPTLRSMSNTDFLKYYTQTDPPEPFKFQNVKFMDIPEDDVEVFYLDFPKGTISIKDVVTKEDVPTVSKLFIYEKYTGVLIASTWSNEQGEFEFTGLDKTKEYIIHSYDKDLQYKSIIKDF